MEIYTKKASSTAEYAKMRGVTDFTNAAQFNLYESGYSHLIIISKPKCIEQSTDDYVIKLLKTFCYILEYEFKGLSGIEDITTDELEVTDGISQLKLMGKVTKQSASEVTMSFTEKSGSAITNFLRYYIEGIRDPRTQAKTYHGLIANGKLSAGFENEVFNMLYIVTDNTMLNIEKAYLLCNAWPTSAKTSIYETEKGSIDKKDIDVTFQCFVLDGPQIDKRAAEILAFVNEGQSVYNVYKNQNKLTKEIFKTNGGNYKEGVIHLISGEVDTTTGAGANPTEFKYDIVTNGDLQSTSFETANQTSKTTTTTA